MRSELCSVLVNTCDKYEDAWYPFFELIKKYWNQCSFPLYLNTESKSYSHPGLDIEVLNVHEDRCLWGKRIKGCLARIDTPYVLLLLEDFFLQNEVDVTELSRCLEIMESDNKIVAIYFKHTTGFNTPAAKYPRYILMSDNKNCKLNLQAALWRKKELMSLISDDDSPWTFETDGYTRVKSNQLFLCSKSGTHTNMSNCVFPYLTDRRLGYGIWAGKWLWNNDKLFEKNGIQIKPISLERFSRRDLCVYYVKRVVEKAKERLK